jgi:hypothetical protein
MRTASEKSANYIVFDAVELPGSLPLLVEGGEDLLPDSSLFPA